MHVVVADDEALFRRGLVELLQNEGITVVGESAHASDTDELVLKLRPDALITDIRMPPTMTNDGFQAAMRIRRELPGQPVVVLTQHVSRSAALELAGTGAGIGYFLKQRITDVTAFAREVRRVAAGGTSLDPEVGRSVASAAIRGGSIALTHRQREVLALMAQGRSNAAIARKLVISEKAVVQHTSRIYDAFGIPIDEDDHRRVLVVLRYLSLRR